jgi:hypothetical protein
MTELPSTVWVTGYHTANDGAFGSHFFRLATDTGQVDNGGTIIRTVNGVYELQYSGAVNVKWFGALNDGSDTTTELQAAIDYSNVWNNSLFFPNGQYGVTSIDTRGNTVSWYLDGAEILAIGTEAEDCVIKLQMFNSTIYNLRVNMSNRP